MDNIKWVASRGLGVEENEDQRVHYQTECPASSLFIMVTFVYLLLLFSGKSPFNVKQPFSLYKKKERGMNEKTEGLY